MDRLEKMPPVNTFAIPVARCLRQELVCGRIGAEDANTTCGQQAIEMTASNSPRLLHIEQLLHIVGPELSHFRDPPRSR